MDNRKFIKIKKPHFASRKDFSHHKTFGASPVQFPDELLPKNIILYDQGSKPSCTAAASCTARSIMTGKTYDEGGQWALELQNQKVLTSDGFPLDVPAKIGKDVGFSVPGQVTPQDKVGGYFWKNSKSPGMDWYDTLRSTQYQLFQQTGKIVPFQFGINWYQNWETSTGIVPPVNEKLLGGHDTVWAGYTNNFPDKVSRGVNPNTWPGHGDNQKFYFDRTTTNKNIGDLGVFYWLDAEDMPDNVQRLGIFLAILQNIKAIYQLFVNYKKISAFPPFIWTDPVSARHSVRVICDEEGLTVDMKNILCACVQVESNFNPQATHPNRDKDGNVWSTDWGIAQINDYFNVGVGKPFPSTDYVLQNPEACIRWMAKMFKAGKANLWASYNQNLYKRYL